MFRFIQLILALTLTFTAVQSHAQRVYAPKITGSGHVEFDNEKLIFRLTPDKIKEMEASEKQVHIQMTQAAREYFYTLTRLNVGKEMVIKSGGGETIQEGIIQQPIDSGIIISKPIESRMELKHFLERVSTGREPKIIEPREEYDAPEDLYAADRKIYEQDEAKSEIVQNLEQTLETKDDEIMKLRKQLLEYQDYERKIQNMTAEELEEAGIELPK